MNFRGIVLTTLIGMIMSLLLGCQNAPDKLPEGMTPTPVGEGAEISEGQQLFEMNCATCHGQYGQNNPGGSSAINMTDPAWQKTHTNEYIVTTIKHGKSFMPAFETTFKEQELTELVKYIRSLPEKAN